jgi:hypothetical protein
VLVKTIPRFNSLNGRDNGNAQVTSGTASALSEPSYTPDSLLTADFSDLDQVSPFSPFSALSLAALDALRGIAPANSGPAGSAAGTAANTGAANSNAFDTIDRAVNGNAVHQTYGLTGAGVTIGIISNAFDAVSGDFTKAVNDGLVDPDANFANDDPSSKSDEGLAMAEIVHEIAPDAHIVFYTGEPGNESAMAQAIDVLSTPTNQTVPFGEPGAGQQGLGCDIVCDDLFDNTQPDYQPGDLVDDAIDSAVARGVTYFTLAANPGGASYYTSNPNSGFTFHLTVNGGAPPFFAYNFGTSANPSPFEEVKVPDAGEDAANRAGVSL